MTSIQAPNSPAGIIFRAALLIIGNEILSGRTKDANLAYLGENLNQRGIRLAEVRVVPDIEPEIIDALNALRRKYDYVFTTGGIGPTHDDITSDCIAKAFGVPLHRHPDAVKAMEAYYAEGQLTDARLKMADVPQGACLIPNPVSSAPGYQIENVFVMAGVPKIMQAMFEAIAPTLKGGAPMQAVTIRVAVGESAIADDLGAVQNRFPAIDIGSYPSMFNGQISVALVLRGTDEKMLHDCSADLQSVLQKRAIPYTLTTGY